MVLPVFLQNVNSTNTTASTNHVRTFFEVLSNSFDSLLMGSTDRLPFIAAGAVVLFVFWLFARIGMALFWRASGKTRLDTRLRILFSRILFVLTILLGIFTAMTVIIPSFRFGDLVAGLGFTSFIVGFATKDILNNLLSGVLILWQQPFRIGDYLFIGNNQGKVEAIGVRATKLRKDDGELVLIPNGDMYSSAVTIRGAGAERRMLLKISLGYDSNIAAAKGVIGGALASVEGVVDEPRPNVVVTDLTGDGVNISIYFWINTDKHKPMQVFDEVATSVKTSLEESEFELFPPASMIVQSAEDAAAKKRPRIDL